MVGRGLEHSGLGEGKLFEGESVSLQNSRAVRELVVVGW